MPEIRLEHGVRSRDLHDALVRIRGMDRRRFLLAAASASLVVARDPLALAFRPGGTPAAFVTADLESHVVVVELQTGEVVGTIRTGPGPRSIESMHERIALVAHTAHGAVTLLDAGKSRIRAELDGFEEPRYTAVHPRLPLAYVTDSAREEVVTLDPVAGRVLRRTAVPGPARHVSISPDGSAILTSLGSKAARIAVLDASDPRRPRLVRTIVPPFLAHDVGSAPDRRTVWVTSGTERLIALYRDGRPARLLEAGAPPQHVTFAATRVFVAAGDDGTVRRHRLDGELVREVGVPVGSYNVTFGFGRVVTPSLERGTLALLDRSGRVDEVRKLARAAHDACVVVTA